MPSLSFPIIDPIAFSIGPFAIRWYALAYVAGLLGGWFYARRLAARAELWIPQRQPKPVDIDDLIVWVALGVVLGGRFGYVLFYNLSAYLAHPLEIFAVWRGGMSFHGGLLGAAAAIVLFARTRGLNPLPCSISRRPLPRSACFSGASPISSTANCGAGSRPIFPMRSCFPHAGPLPRHPSQLYEALGEGLLLFIVMAIAVRLFGFRRPGLLGGIFIFGYAVARIVCEFFREPDEQLGFLFGASVQALSGGITMGMLLSIPMALLGVAVIIVASRGDTQSRAEAA